VAELKEKLAEMVKREDEHRNDEHELRDHAHEHEHDHDHEHREDEQPEDDPDDPLKDYNTLNNELALYSKALAEKEQILVLNKMDVPGAPELSDLFQSALGDVEVFRISAATTKGVAELKEKLAEMVKREDEHRNDEHELRDHGHEHDHEHDHEHREDEQPEDDPDDEL